MSMYTTDDLARVCEYVADGLARIAEQRARIEKLQTDGHDTREAERILSTMLDLLVDMQRHRDDIEFDLRSRTPAGQTETQPPAGSGIAPG